jgi:hypothetical protein
MSNTSPDISCILVASAYVFAFLAIRRLSDPNRSRFRWQYADDLVRDGGIAALFAIAAALFARALAPAVGIALLFSALVAWLVVSTYLSRRARDEGRAHVEAILAGKYDHREFP